MIYLSKFNKPQKQVLLEFKVPIVLNTNEDVTTVKSLPEKAYSSKFYRKFETISSHKPSMINTMSCFSPKNDAEKDKSLTNSLQSPIMIKYQTLVSSLSEIKLGTKRNLVKNSKRKVRNIHNIVDKIVTEKSLEGRE